MPTTLEQVTQIVGDKELLHESLICQKQISSEYNTYAGECKNDQLRNTFLDILSDEHCIQADVFNNMYSNGWYKLEPADQNKVATTKQKYSAQP